MISPAGDGERLLLAVGLGAARTVPLCWAVPALGGPRVAPEVRAGLGILLAVLCLPALLPAVGASAIAANGPVGWTLVLARELLVGLTVGLCVGAGFRAAEAAGRLADLARGANLAEVLSPMSDERTSPTGDLYLFVAVIVFLELGGLRVFAQALGRSYEAVPLGAASSALFPGGLRAAAALVTAAVAKLMEAALGLAAPVLVASWLADATLGLVARTAPQIPIYFAAIPAKALLGLGVSLVGLGAIEAVFAGGFQAWATLFDQALAGWRPR